MTSSGRRSALFTDYARFLVPVDKQVMEELAGRAMQYAEEQEPDLPGILGGVKDWRIVDSMTVRLHDDLKEVYPGTGDYAALKLHKTLSVGCGTVVDYHLSPAREHDSPHLVLDESWRGMGLLVDLGYASLERLRQCQRFDVSLVIRLKSNWKPKVQAIVRGQLSKTFTPGTELDLESVRYFVYRALMIFRRTIVREREWRADEGLETSLVWA
ncbi:transposase [Haliangium ochraceum]|uniref:transposase n=1 Tax=Haliangium ochraceum TaxID=80816 RepID=UPI000BB49E10|nr:transposase [Haliangium ochraceum]